MMDFKERLNKITQRNLKVKHKKNTTWPLEKRIEAVTQYLVLGNMKQVSALTGISYDLLKEWKSKPWWMELSKEIRASQNIEMDTKLSKIVEKSLEATLDRVENGDIIMGKDGDFRRKPAPLRDVHRVAVDTLARREILRDKQFERGETTPQLSVDEHLKIVAQKMAQWFEVAQKPVIELNKEDVTDVTEKDTDAVHEERETRLQEGKSAVQQSSRDSGETGQT